MSTAPIRDDKNQPGADVFRTFMLRCWRERQEESDFLSSWRLVLVEMDTPQKRKGFADLDELVDYLRKELGRE